MLIKKKINRVKNETIVMDRFNSLGVIKNEVNYDENKLQHFTDTIATMKNFAKIFIIRFQHID